jgi:hypothetical protein
MAQMATEKNGANKTALGRAAKSRAKALRDPLIRRARGNGVSR